jgi:hypothetical protein
MVLQDCMDLLKGVPGPCGEAHVACSHIKIEEDIDVQEEKDPLLVPFPFIKTEQEVRFMSVCALLHTYLLTWKYPILFNGF